MAIHSTYGREGEIETAEVSVLVKSSEAYPALEAAIQELHPYEVPEIVALPIEAGSRAYLSWLQGELRAAA